jgi:chaperonin GroEL
MHATLDAPLLDVPVAGFEATMPVDVLDVVQLDAGYLSPYFVTDPATMEAVLEAPLILLSPRRISSRWDFLPILAQVVRAGRSLLVIADDVEGDALATLVVNKISGMLPCVAVRLPESDAGRRGVAEELHLLMGGQPSLLDGLPLELLTLHDLASAKRVRVTRDHTTIVGGPPG